MGRGLETGVGGNIQLYIFYWDSFMKLCPPPQYQPFPNAVGDGEAVTNCLLTYTRQYAWMTNSVTFMLRTRGLYDLDSANSSPVLMSRI